MSEPTEKQISEAVAYWNSREGQAELLLNRATRLFKFIKLKAPELVIESERQLVFKSLMTFPVDEAARVTKVGVDRQIHEQEQQALLKSGYYDEFKDAS